MTQPPDIRVLPGSSGELRERLRRGEPAVGTFAGLSSPAAVEVCAAAGADWVLIDLEHGAGDEGAVASGVLACAAYGVPALVRVERLDRLRIGRCLDLGAAGIMVPRIDSARDADRLVRWMRYPPAGERGVATYNRQAGFGLRPEVLAERDGQLVTIVQIETAAGLDAVDEIAAVDGIDALFVGPVDLSYALGVPMGFTTDVFRLALDRVLAAARKHGVAAGIMAKDAPTAVDQLRRGFRLVSVGSDSAMLAAAYRAAFTATARSTDPEEPR
jgi:4-hydroxy-2-oxoheptanedioate aldolase